MWPSCGRLARRRGLDLTEAIGRLEETIGIIPGLAEAIAEDRLVDASALVWRISVGEMEAYEELGRIVGFAQGGA